MGYDSPDAGRSINKEEEDRFEEAQSLKMVLKLRAKERVDKALMSYESAIRLH